jgi:hypothetical protein
VPQATHAAGLGEIQTGEGESVVVSDITSDVSDAVQKSILTECVTKEIFPFKKFILLEQELNFGERLQKRVCYKLNVEQEQDVWWKENKELIRKRLTKKRNNVQEAIRRKLMSKCTVAVVPLKWNYCPLTLANIIPLQVYLESMI